MSKRKEKKKAPIVVVAGAPEWMVTFGDLMSLLLTFFVLLFSVSEIKSEKIFDVIVAFRSEFDVDIDADAVLLDFTEVTRALSSLSTQMPDRAEGSKGRSKEKVENPFGNNAAIHRVKDDFHIDIEGAVLFEPGSSQLSEEGVDLIARISRRLRGGFNRIKVLGQASPTEDGIDGTTLAFQRSRAVHDILISPSLGERGIEPVRLEIGTRGGLDPMTVQQIRDPDRLAARDRVVIILTPEPVRELQEAARKRDRSPAKEKR